MGENKGEEEGEESRVWHLISHSLGPHPWIHLLLRLLSPLCHRLCLLSNVNGVAFACPPPPSWQPLRPTPSCRRLVVLSTCEQLSGGYQFGPFVARLQPKVAWLIYVLLACFLCCLPLLSHLSLSLRLLGFFITRMTRFSSTSLILTLAIILGSGKL